MSKTQVYICDNCKSLNKYEIDIIHIPKILDCPNNNIWNKVMSTHDDLYFCNKKCLIQWIEKNIKPRGE